MPRPKEHKNQAERQAAYRARHPEKRPPREDLLATLANSLHFVLGEAIQKDRCPLPHQLVGARPDETMRNLIYYFDPAPNPIRYHGMEGKPKA